jgi:hypothetical protein
VGLVGLLGEEEAHHALRVLEELGPLPGGVAVAEDEQVHLGGRVAVLLERHERARAGGRGTVHLLGLGVHGQGPGLLPAHVRRAAEEVDDDGTLGLGEAQGFGEGPAHLRRLARVLPLAEDAGEAPRIEEAAAFGIPHLELEFAEVGVVHRLGGIAGPGEGLAHHALQGEGFGAGAARVGVVHPQGAGGGREGRAAEEGEEETDHLSPSMR